MQAAESPNKMMRNTAIVSEISSPANCFFISASPLHGGTWRLRLGSRLLRGGGSRALGLLHPIERAAYRLAPVLQESCARALVHHRLPGAIGLAMRPQLLHPAPIAARQAGGMRGAKRRAFRIFGPADRRVQDIGLKLHQQ